jgi:hypothetical protein
VSRNNTQRITPDYYGRNLLRAAPAEGVGAVAKSFQGGVGKYVESRLKKDPVTFAEAMKGRGIGRGLGGLGPRLVLAPVFYHEMADIKQRGKASPKNIAVLSGLGATAAGIKGLVEASVENKHLDTAAKALMTSRALSGAASAAYLASSIAKNIGASERGNRTTRDKLMHEVVKPTLYGAVAGAGKGAWDKVFLNAVKHQPISRDVIPALAGRAVAGALGGLVLQRIGRWMLPSNKRKG